METIEKLIEVAVEGSDRLVRIGSQLSRKILGGLVFFLQKNMDVFGWSHEDMPFQVITRSRCMDPTIMSHRLSIDPTAKPIKQKKMYFALERNRAIIEEV